MATVSTIIKICAIGCNVNKIEHFVNPNAFHRRLSSKILKRSRRRQQQGPLRGSFKTKSSRFFVSLAPKGLLFMAKERMSYLESELK